MIARHAACQCAAASAVVLGGCVAATRLPDDDRLRAHAELGGQVRHLRVSSYLVADERRALRVLAPSPPNALGASAAESTTAPPAVERIVPAGTRVRIERLEFPTLPALVRRPPGPARDRPWLYLALEGDRPGTPVVMAIDADLASYDDVVAELDRFFADESLAAVLEGFSGPVRAAVARRELLAGMEPAAVEMAWGYPVRRTLVLRDGAREEEWIYADGRRHAFFAAGRLIRFEVGGDAPKPVEGGARVPPATGWGDGAR